MRDVRVNKHQLKAKLLENRAGHRQIFEEALEGYKAKSLELLEQHVAEVKFGKVVRIVVSLPFPEDHTEDYDRVIAMLEMSVDEEVLIDESTFANYVMDQWSWTRQFLASNSAYSATAARLSSP